MAGPMHKLPQRPSGPVFGLPGTAMLGSGVAIGQGSVNFANVDVGLNAPFFDTDGVTRLHGDDFVLDYAADTLRLVNAQSHQAGPLVPSSAPAVELWNVAPDVNNDTTQSGRTWFTATDLVGWKVSSTVLADLTFEIQAQAAQQYQWTLNLSHLKVTENGYDHQQFNDGRTYFIGRTPVAAQLLTSSLAVNDDGFAMTLMNRERHT